MAFGYGVRMSYAAIEVELREGRLIPRGSEPLPKSGAGLLVILSEGLEASTPAPGDAGWLPALAEIRKQQAARGHAPRTADAVAQQLHVERESWDW
jgi:hypothetical protein